MATRIGWTHQQLLVAFNLYCQMPFGKMHSRNSEIIKYAELIGRTPSALAMKLTNIASSDSLITSTGRKGLQGASAADKNMWDHAIENYPKAAHWRLFNYGLLTGRIRPKPVYCFISLNIGGAPYLGHSENATI